MRSDVKGYRASVLTVRSFQAVHGMHGFIRPISGDRIHEMIFDKPKLKLWEMVRAK